MVHLVLKSTQRYCKLLQTFCFVLFLPEASKHLVAVVLLHNKIKKKKIELNFENLNIKIISMLASVAS